MRLYQGKETVSRVRSILGFYDKESISRVRSILGFYDKESVSRVRSILFLVPRELNFSWWNRSVLCSFDFAHVKV